MPVHERSGGELYVLNEGTTRAMHGGRIYKTHFFKASKLNRS
jgi:hypothetical protein